LIEKGAQKRHYRGILNHILDLFDIHSYSFFNTIMKVAMMKFALSSVLLRTALARVGALLTGDNDIEILVVGGAAGLLTGVLPPSRTTMDCDVMVYLPANAWHAVEEASHRVGRELGLSTSWLNGVAQLRIDSLPERWQERRVHVGDFDSLRVYAISRLDLIAMKFLAHRAQDLEDLQSLRAIQAEIQFARVFVNGLRGSRTPRQEIDEALEILDEWMVTP